MLFYMQGLRPELEVKQQARCLPMLNLLACLNLHTNWRNRGSDLLLLKPFDTVRLGKFHQVHNGDGMWIKAPFGMIWNIRKKRIYDLSRNMR